METARKPYLLLFRDSGSETYKHLSFGERERLLAQWNAWYEGLAQAGKLRHGHPLEPEGKIVSARGERDIDGPFAEAKEAVGGYFFVLVEGLEEAVQIARQCPSLPLGLTVEVRPVAEICPVLTASVNAALGVSARN